MIFGKKQKNYFNNMHTGIDIGGHKINGVLMDGNKIVKKQRVLTKSRTNKKIILEQIFDCIENLIKDNKKKIQSIGIGVPSSVDLEKQKILGAPNVPALKKLFLAKIVQEKFKIKTRIENDANCFGLAEAIFGAGKKKKIIAGLTLGTGVGGFVIIHKKIFRGKSSRATEFGHINIASPRLVRLGRSRQCTCGRKGCLEAYVSARGIMETAHEVGLEGINNSKEITDLAKKGVKKAIDVYRITGDYLGTGLEKIIKKFKPEIIIIGGGISGAGEFILNSAKKVIKNIKTVKTELGEDAGAIGAALL